MRTTEQQYMIDTVVSAYNEERTERKLIVATAVAGAGKTTTCLDIYKELTGDQTKQFVAFNVKAKDELIARGVDAKHAKTLNGLGHANLSRYARNRGLKLDVSAGKVNNCLKQANETLYWIGPVRKFARKMVDYVKAEGLTTYNRPRLEKLADHYEVFIDMSYKEAEDKGHNLDELEDQAYKWVAETMVINNRVPESGTWIIDYNDQIYLPVILNIPCFQNDLLLVDEAQDLSNANKHLINKCLKNNGVLVLVGDDYQCIYAWRGCEVDGLQKTLSREHLKPVATPLTYNWRSGKQIIEFAQEICPEIQCGNGKEASVTTEDLNKFDVLKVDGDAAVLSRLRAPLIGYAIECLKNDKPFTFRFSLQFIIETIKQVGDDNLSIRAFKRRLKAWLATKAELYEQQDAEAALEELDDMSTILETLLEKVRTTDTVHDLISIIRDLDGQIRKADGSLTLSTIHGSKGLEWDTTYVIGFEDIGNRATKEWKIKEARNLSFVACTRAKSNLIFLSNAA